MLQFGQENDSPLCETKSRAKNFDTQVLLAPRIGTRDPDGEPEFRAEQCFPKTETHESFVGGQGPERVDT